MTTTSSKGRRAHLLPDTIPTDRDRVLEHAEAVLSERDRVFGTLARTSVSIPHLLQQRQTLQSDGSPSAEGKLQDVQRQLAAQTRLRLSSIEELSSKDEPLIAAREPVEALRLDYGGSAMAAWEDQHSRLLAAVAQSEAQGRALSSAVRIPISLPTPSVMEATTTGSRAPAVPVDELASRIGDVLNKLDSVIGFGDRIKEMRSRDGKRERSNSAPAGFRGDAVFLVLKAFRCQISGVEFQPGQLIDQSLVSAPSLARLYITHHIGYADRSTARTTAA